MWGHDILWWLDRMVRSEAPLVERMTLVWHDWFATSRAVVDARWMLRQNELLRRHALGDFGALVREITRDPAMLTWLNGIDNTREEPNENYARELQELFTLGAGRGYSERDVREMARALTGWRADWRDGVGHDGLPLRPRRATTAGASASTATAGATTGATPPTWPCGTRATRASSSTKLWSYFIPTPPPPRTRARARAPLPSLRATTSGRSSARSCAIRCSTTARGWSSRPPSTPPGCCARWAAASTPTTGRG